MEKIENAAAKFVEGFNCAQAVFHAFHEDLGIEETLALKLTSGFGGGMGKMQEVCGAVSGGVLALSAKYGHSTVAELEAQNKTRTLVQELINRFTEQYGSCRCKDILHGIDFKTPEGHTQFQEQDLRNKVCVPCVRSVVQIVEGMLGG